MNSVSFDARLLLLHLRVAADERINAGVLDDFDTLRDECCRENT